MPTKPEIAPELPDVELIERDDFELDDKPAATPPEASPILGSRSVAAISIAVILLALAVMSRPGESPVVDPDAGQTTTTQPTTSVPVDANGAVSGASTTAVTQAIPLFDVDLPTELPGVLTGVDIEGSLISIDRGTLRPDETRLDMGLVEADPKATFIVPGLPPIRIDRDLSYSSTRLVVSHSDRFLEPGFELTDVVPTRTGDAVVIDHLSNSQEVVLIPIDWDGVDESRLSHWVLPTNGIEVLGAWEGSLVLHQAGRTWTLTPGSGPTAAGIGTATEPLPVLAAEGTVLAYDGQYLTRLTCPAPGACQIAVGPLDEPDRYVVAVPEMLVPLDHEAWTSSVSISNDGTRMAVSARFGALSLPVVIDLETGVAISRSDGMNHQAPVAWSPDGQWLAFPYTDDVMVWNFQQDRSWRISVNRQIQRLAWHVQAERTAEDAAPDADDDTDDESGAGSDRTSDDAPANPDDGG